MSTGSNPCSLDESSFFSYRHDHWLSFRFSFVLTDYSLLFYHSDILMNFLLVIQVSIPPLLLSSYQMVWNPSTDSQSNLYTIHRIWSLDLQGDLSCQLPPWCLENLGQLPDRLQ